MSNNVKKEEPKKGVFVTYSGTYYCNTKTLEKFKTYKVEIQLTDNPNYKLPLPDKIKYLGKKKVLPFYFRTNIKDYPDYEAIREIYVDNIDIIGGDKINKKDIDDKSIEYMTLAELVQFTIDKDLVTDPNHYADIITARQAVLDEWENRKIAQGCTKTQEEIEKEKEEEEFADVADLLTFTGAK